MCDTEPGCQAIARTFAELANVGADVAARLVAVAHAASATSCAVVIRTSERTFASAAGEARTYQHVGNRLVPLAAGEAPSAASQLLIVASAPLVGEQRDFLGTGPGGAIAIAFAQQMADAGILKTGPGTFEPPDTSSLDAVLERALAGTKQPAVAVAASCTGFLSQAEVDALVVKEANRELLARAVAVSPTAAARLVTRIVETTDDYAGLSEAIKELHAVYFFADAVRTSGGLEKPVSSYGASPNFIAMTLRGLARIGAHMHRDLVLEAVPFLVHFKPALAPVMAELGLAARPKSTAWELDSEWSDLPLLPALAAWHVERAYPDFASDPPATPIGPTLTPPEELAAAPKRRDLIAGLSRRLGTELTPTSVITDAQREALSDVMYIDLYGEMDLNSILNRVYDEKEAWSLHRSLATV